MYDNPRWRADRNLQYKLWPDGVVVYDRRSGDTHYLQTRAWQILDQVSQAPCRESELVSRLAQNLGLPQEQLRSDITSLLADLHTLGLVEPENN